MLGGAHCGKLGGGVCCPSTHGYAARHVLQDQWTAWALGLTWFPRLGVEDAFARTKVPRPRQH